MLVQIQEQISVQQALDFVQSPENGGVAIFVGNVRNNTQGREVLKLYFECYEPMAIYEMEKIAAYCINFYHIRRVAILHVTGEKLPGETVVVIAAAAPHRAAAFDACEYAIDTLKETVPIWKKEYFTDGAMWVAAHP